MCPQVVFYITPTGPCLLILKNNCSTRHLPQKHTMYQCKKIRLEIGANVDKIRTQPSSAYKKGFSQNFMAFALI